MTDHEHTELVRRAKSLAISVNRFVQLCELKAPGVFIESERQIAAKRMASLPVSLESLQANERMRDDMEDAQQKHLHATGYYDDAEKL